MASITLEALKAKMTPKHLLAAELILENEFRAKGDKRTYEEIATEAGIAPRTLYNYRQEPEFVQYLAAISDTKLDGYRSMADAQLVKLMNGTSNNGTPSIKALELYYKIIGKLVDKREVVSAPTATTVQDVDVIKAEIEKLRRTMV